MNRIRPSGTPSTLLGASALVLLAACNGSASDRSARSSASGALDAPRVATFDNPADSSSELPGLTVSPKGNLYLSWQTRRPDSSIALRYAIRTGNTWSPVHDVTTGTNILSSAVDVPTVHEQPNGKLVALWRGSHASSGYDIVIAHSTDAGKSWSSPQQLHHDKTDAEHGFTSWLQLGDTTALVWVDGRGNSNADKAKRATALAFVHLDSADTPGLETFIDPKICDCCHTSAVPMPGGAVVVYRDRREGEIRDINAVRLVAGVWREPVSVHNDGWHIEGCPVNGPAVAAAGEKVAVAWFTAAGDSARVRLAFSRDTARTFGDPVEINEGFPDGRVGVAMSPAGNAVVSWIERRGAVAVLRLRTVRNDGTRSAAVDVAELGESKRAGGQPKLVVDGDHAVLAWTDSATHRVRTARVDIP